VWPHHIVVGVNGVAISVASDTPEIIALLEPWRVAVDAELVDYAIELDPPPPDSPRGMRPLPRLTHGTCDLFRLRDPDQLTLALMRILASFSAPAEPDRIRVGLMPLVHQDRALLVETAHAGRISPRWYRAHSVTPIYGLSSVVNVSTLTVEIDEPLLGGTTSATPTSLPLLDWWLPSADVSLGLSPGEAVAFVMRLAVDITGTNARASLERAAQLVELRPPQLAPAASDHINERFNPARAKRIRTQITEAIQTLFDG